jgi:ectoine hydrolase
VLALSGAPFPNAEFETRLERIRTRMRAGDLDSLVVVDPANIYYLTGYDAWSFYTPQALVVGPADHFLYLREIDLAGVGLTTFMKESQVATYPDITLQRPDRHPFERLAGILAERGLGGGRVGVERDAYFFSPRAEDALRLNLPGAELVDSGELVNWARAIKSPAELELMRTAARVAEGAMTRALEVIRPGVRQCDAVAAISAAQIAGTEEAGGDYPSIVPMLPSGEGTAAAHLTWSDRPFVAGEPTVIELAGVHRRYHCPLARTVQLGTPPAATAKLAEVTVEGAEAALGSVRPGVSCEEVEAAWRETIARHGFEKQSRIGYSVGIGYPPDWGEHTMSLRPGDQTALEEGMTFHMILGMWLDEIGFEVSETFAVGATGAVPFCRFPRRLFTN